MHIAVRSDDGGASRVGGLALQPLGVPSDLFGAARPALALPICLRHRSALRGLTSAVNARRCTLRGLNLL